MKELLQQLFLVGHLVAVIKLHPLSSIYWNRAREWKTSVKLYFNPKAQYNILMRINHLGRIVR